MFCIVLNLGAARKGAPQSCNFEDKHESKQEEPVLHDPYRQRRQNFMADWAHQLEDWSAHFRFHHRWQAASDDKAIWSFSGPTFISSRS